MSYSQGLIKRHLIKERLQEARTGSREPLSTLGLAVVENMPISRSEGTREEAVLLGPSESSGHGAGSIETATARTEAGREMGVSVNTSAPFSSPLLFDFCLRLPLAKSICSYKESWLMQSIEVSFLELREGQENVR